MPEEGDDIKVLGVAADYDELVAAAVTGVKR